MSAEQAQTISEIQRDFRETAGPIGDELLSRIQLRIEQLNSHHDARIVWEKTGHNRFALSGETFRFSPEFLTELPARSYDRMSPRDCLPVRPTLEVSNCTPSNGRVELSLSAKTEISLLQERSTYDLALPPTWSDFETLIKDPIFPTEVSQHHGRLLQYHTAHFEVPNHLHRDLRLANTVPRVGALLGLSIEVLHERGQNEWLSLTTFLEFIDERLCKNELLTITPEETLWENELAFSMKGSLIRGSQSPLYNLIGDNQIVPMISRNMSTSGEYEILILRRSETSPETIEAKWMQTRGEHVVKVLDNYGK